MNPFKRLLKKSIQKRWKYRKGGKPLDQIFMSDLGPDGKFDPQRRKRRLEDQAKKATEKKERSIHISPYDAY